MSEKLLRVYKKLNIKEIQKHLLIYGDLAGSCANCNQMDVALNAHKCPGCSAEFKYLAFRSVWTQLSKINKMMAERPSMMVIDYDDFKKGQSALKAEEFLK